MSPKPRQIALFIVLGVIVIFLSSYDPKLPSVYSQDDANDACTTLVDDAISVAGTACAGMGHNEACYGNRLVSATFREDRTTQFDDSGDITDLGDIEAMFTQPANPDDGTWGVALMTVQGDLPEYSGESVTYVLFGDAQVTDAEDGIVSPVTCEVTTAGTNNINVRSGPGTDRDIVGVFPVGQSGIADGRNETGDWVHLNWFGTPGWLYAPLMDVSCDIETLTAYTADKPPEIAPQRPMQSIYLESGNSETCELAPDGLLVRSPEGQRARIVVNGVEIVMSSTAFLTAQPDGDFTLQTLEGSVDVSADGQTVTVLDGFFTTVPLDGLDADGPPTPPQPVDPNTELPAFDTAGVALTSNSIGMARCGLQLPNGATLSTGPHRGYAPVTWEVSENTILDIIAKTDTDFSDGEIWKVRGGGWILPSAGVPIGNCSNLPEFTSIVQQENITEEFASSPFCWTNAGDTIQPVVHQTSCDFDKLDIHLYDTCQVIFRVTLGYASFLTRDEMLAESEGTSFALWSNGVEIPAFSGPNFDEEIWVEPISVSFFLVNNLTKGINTIYSETYTFQTSSETCTVTVE